ncbi:Lateral organ boundaries domain containing protein [Trema orientale]|uniref:Lateral organ boundaries domain containing protein n=1 Tax=Trema orientale TaxID=63057 RepID=A0A2P5C1B2_TREOI|nr:Lateral organ boundaries domain containing protein [Trema orientale]
MTIKGGASQACAACKYQRRKCSKDCPLGPFFPADQPEKFQYAHRLFGVRNINNILKQVSPQYKQDAMTSIIFESAMRARFPVHGCLGIIKQLQTQLEQNLEELRLVHTSLAICKDQYQQQQIQYSSNDDVPIQQHIHHQFNSASLPMFSNYESLPVFSNHGSLTEGINNSIYISGDQGHHEYFAKPITIQNPSSNDVEPALQQTQLQYPSQQEVDVSYYGDIPFGTIVDDRQSFIESKEPCESSAESSLKKAIQMKNEHSSTEHHQKNEC